MKNKRTKETMKSLIGFCLPLILSGMLQQLYNWADAFIVGNAEGESALSAVGAATAPINFFVTLMTGFGIGISVLAARYFGEKKDDKIPGILSFFSLILFGIFAVLTAIGSHFSFEIMSLLETPAETVELATEYIRVIFFGFPFLAVYNIYSAVLRGVGDSKTPFAAILVSSAVNVGLDILFVMIFKRGVFGAATATVFSQIAMTVFTVIYTAIKHPTLRFTLNRKNCQGALSAGLKYGIPPMIQSCITSLGGLVLQSFMNSFGADTVTAITCAYRIDTLVMLPIVNLGSGISTFTSQSIGEGDREKAERVLKSGIVLSIAVSVLLTAAVIPTGGYLISLFGAGDTAVKIGSAFFLRLASFYPVFGVLNAVRGYLEGADDLVFSSVAGIGSLAIRIAASYALAPRFGNMVIAYAEMIAWGLLLIIYMIRFGVKKRKEKHLASIEFSVD